MLRNDDRGGKRLVQRLQHAGKCLDAAGGGPDNDQPLAVIHGRFPFARDRHVSGAIFTDILAVCVTRRNRTGSIGSLTGSQLLC